MQIVHVVEEQLLGSMIHKYFVLFCIYVNIMGHKMLTSSWCVLDRNLGSELNEHIKPNN